MSDLGAICNPKITITDYQTLPEGKTVLHHSWSGDLLGGAFYYMPKGVSPNVLSFWGPEQTASCFNGYVPPQKAIDADTLISRGLIPKSLEPAVVRPDQFAANQELLQLSVAGERLWDQAWSRFKAG